VLARVRNENKYFGEIRSLEARIKNKYFVYIHYANGHMLH